MIKNDEKNSYQYIREQLVTLSVEIDDRSKLFDVLNEKIDEIKNEISYLERDYERKFTTQIEDEIIKYRNTYEELTEKNNQAIQTKKNLIDEAKSLVEILKKSDEDYNIVVRNLHSKTLHDIESDRKTFRLGREERQKKEIMDTTERALESEFSRLRIANEHEIGECELKLASDEKRALSEVHKQFEEKIQEEEKLFRENQRNLTKNQLDETIREVENLERAHKIKLQHMNEDNLHELERYKHELNLRVQKELEEQDKILKDTELKSREKIRQLKSYHEEDLQTLETDHSTKIKNIQQQYVAKKKEYERLLKQRNNEGEDGEDGDMLLNQSKYTESEKLLYERYKKELQETKSKQIKAEIRKLQIETNLIEKETKEKFDIELKRLQDASIDEEKYLKKKQESLSKEISELSNEKSELLNELKVLQDELYVYQDKIRDVKSQKKEKIAIDSKLNEKKKEIEERYQERIEQLTIENEMIIKDLQDQIKELSYEREYKNREYEDLLKRFENDHEMRLQQMNDDVRRDISKISEEKDLLLDAIQTEKVKATKLKKMLQKYNININ